MSLVDDELARAEANSEESRRRLANTVVALQSRLKPSVLARDAIDELKEVGGDIAKSGVDAVKRNPLPAIGVAAAVTAFVARKPISRLFRKKPAPDEKRKDK
ncbi:MAG: DUF3618 domain-containing protein [Proteobacteria bacterium]|nr:DUF3618 domain-containing protein [Pseudomonadota bacterium]